MNKFGKYLGGFIKFLIAITIIAILICLFIFRDVDKKPSIQVSISDEKEHEEILMENFFNEKDYEERLKSEASDINGMTKYDKYVMGLDPADNADSDMDGLTDKEEIEIYGSNPAKASTSGDLYTDGHKVENGMDLKKYYEYDGEYEFPYNQCPEILLNASDVTDFNAWVIDYTGSSMFNLSGKKPLKTYRVSFYGNYVTIDLSLIESTKDLSPNELTIYVQEFDETEARVMNFTVDGSKITLKEKCDFNMPYTIYVVKEKGTLSKIFSPFSVGIDVTFGSANAEPQENPSGIVYGFPFLSFFGSKLNVMYEDMGNNNTNGIVKKNLISVANDIQEGIQTIDEADDCVSAGSETKISLLTRFFKNTLAKFEYPGKVTEEKWYHALFIYYTYEDYMNYIANNPTEEVEPQPASGIKYAGDFNVYEDTLRFPNFRTQMADGVCAGIAHLTSYLHNNRKLDKTDGTFNYNGKKYSWDITTDPENATLMNTGLSDYKTPYFSYEHKSEAGILEKNLTDGEQNFVTMLNYFWAKGNNAFVADDYTKGIDGRDADKDIRTMCHYDGTVIRNMLKELDKGNIVDAYFLLNNNTGHVVNIYAYEEAETHLGGLPTPGYVFYVYDSNYPDTIGTLTAEIYNHSNGQETLLYRLNIPGASYYASSNSGRKTLFVVLDSDFNVLSN